MYGFSPHQLVFGKNATFPSNLHNKLPALDDQCDSVVMRDNLNVLHTARENYIKLESCAKLKKALRSKTRTHTAKSLQIGQRVYFKRNRSEKWRGVGKIVGFDGVFVKEGGLICKLHSCRILLENSEFCAAEEDNVSHSSDSDLQTDIVVVADDLDTDDEQEQNSENQNRSVVGSVGPAVTEETAGGAIDVRDTVETNDSEMPSRSEDDDDTGSGNSEVDSCITDGQATRQRTQCQLPKKKSTLMAELKDDDDDYQKIKVLGRGGKANTSGHVDDFFWCGSEKFRTEIIDKIISRFHISSDLHDSFTFLGLKVHQLPHGIILNQENYADKIQYLPQNTENSKHESQLIN